MSQAIYMASDHGGFELKNQIKQHLEQQGLTITDLGTHSDDSVDYPDFAHQIATKVASEKNALGILLCGTGIGASIAANRHKNVRAALVTNELMASMAKKHNDANILVLGGRILDAETAIKLVNVWRTAVFEGDRHSRRIAKIDQIDE